MGRPQMRTRERNRLLSSTHVARGGAALLGAALVSGSASAGDPPPPPPLPETPWSVVLPGEGRAIELDPETGLVWVSIPDEFLLVAVAPRSRQIAGSVRLGPNPMGLERSVDGTRLFVALNDAGRVVELGLDDFARRSFPVAHLVGDPRIFDVGEAVPGRLVVTANPGSNGSATAVEIPINHPGAETDPTLQSLAVNGASLRCDPDIETDQAAGFGYIGLCFSPNDLKKYDGTLPGSPLVLDADFGTVGGTDSIGLSPDGAELVLRSGKVHDTATFDVVAETGLVRNWRFTEEGTRLVGSASGTAIVLDRATLAELQSFVVPGVVGEGPGEMTILPGDAGFAILTDDRLSGSAAIGGCDGAPPASSRPAPAEGAADVRSDGDVELRWLNAGAGCPTTYEVRVGTSNPPTTVLADRLQVPWTTAPPPAAGETRYWQVIATNDAGTTAGPVWSFAGAPCPVPAPSVVRRVLAAPPFDAVGDPQRGRVYVSLPDANAIVAFDLVSGVQVAGWSLPGPPAGMDLALDGTTLWVIENANGRIFAVDPDTGAIRQQFSIAGALGDSRGWDVLEARPNLVYATANPGSQGTARVVEIDVTGANPPRRVASNQIVRHEPALAVTPDRRWLLVGEDGQSFPLLVLDLDIDAAPIVGGADRSGRGAQRLSISRDGRRVALQWGGIVGLEDPLNPFRRGELGGAEGIFGNSFVHSAFADESDVLWTIWGDDHLRAHDVATGWPVGAIELPPFASGPDLVPWKLVPLPGLPGEGFRGFAALYESNRLHLVLRPAWDDCDGDAVPDDCAIAQGLVNDVNGDGIPDPCQLLGDLDGDGCVGFADLVVLLSWWSVGCDPLDPAGGACAADLNGDGIVDAADLIVLLAGFTGCG